MKKIFLILLISITSVNIHSNTLVNNELKNFIKNNHIHTGYSEKELIGIFYDVEINNEILKKMDNQPESKIYYSRYESWFINKKNIKEGKNFIKKNINILRKAELKFGVPYEIIAAIIGVETRYGNILGKHRIIDSLSTLSFFYERRKNFFQSELKNYLILTKRENLNPLNLKGSYAGAMGYGQFMPSSYLSFGVDGNSDGTINLYDVNDAILSIGNYLNKNGWKSGEYIISEMKLRKNNNKNILNKSLKPNITIYKVRKNGYYDKLVFNKKEKVTPFYIERDKNKKDYYVGLNNFYTITKYNRSRMYALVVFKLAKEISDRNKKYYKFK